VIDGRYKFDIGIIESSPFKETKNGKTKSYFSYIVRFPTTPFSADGETIQEAYLQKIDK